jgi:hypothetical protein
MSDADHMPDDLRSVLSDPGIVIRQDAAVFELIARWAHAPAATATAKEDTGGELQADPNSPKFLENDEQGGNR